MLPSGSRSVASRSPSLLMLTCLLLPTLGSTAGVAQAPPVDPQAAAVHWRQIGWMSDLVDPCPQPGGGWSAPTRVDVVGERFCLYRFQLGPVTQQDLAVLQGQAILDGVGPDRMAVASMGMLDDLLTPRQADLFTTQAGAVTLPPTTSTTPVRLTVIDTQPDGLSIDSEIEENSDHGRTLRTYAHRFLCAGESCLVETDARLALAYTAFHPADPSLSSRDEVHGGVVGTIGELGESIARAVSDAATSSGPAARRVLNLSVAWDGALFGGLERDPSGAFDPAAMPIDVRLVFRALQAASRVGFVVVAAAGNRADHRQAPGALLPAAWEQVAAPEDGSPEGGSPSAYRPLLYAVAAVGTDGRLVANGQAQSRGPMVAYGDHAVLAGEGGGSATATLTGSSVAALVVSSSAAAAWAYAPWLDAASLMDLVYQSGDPLVTEGMDLCLPEPDRSPCATARPMVRRISICRAVEQVCAATGTCPSPFNANGPSPCLGWQPRPTDLGDVDLSTFVPAAITTVSDITPTWPVPAICELPSYHDVATPPAADPCVSWQYNGMAATPWAHPQPGSTPCPNCPLTRGALTIEIGEHFQGIVHSPSLVACGVTLSLPVPPLGDDFAHTHQVDGIELPSDCTQGLLTFAWDNPDGDDASTVSPIRISP